ncbi:unnamed protein product, partial [Didymodactylos carnosus]
TLTNDERGVLINGLDYVIPTNRLYEEQFIAIIEACFVSLLGYCTEQFD